MKFREHIHAQTPWKLVEHNWQQTSIYSDQDVFVATLCIGDDVDERDQDHYEAIRDANAAFIIKAVNCHQELVDALRLARAEINMIENDRSSETALQAIDAALKSAEAA